uniref:Uncharacterized protein n=1 Tax=Psilocybe cubensis TaxID=181762 RepID=A0A8H7XUX0_PSICU
MLRKGLPAVLSRNGRLFSSTVAHNAAHNHSSVHNVVAHNSAHNAFRPQYAHNIVAHNSVAHNSVAHNAVAHNFVAPSSILLMSGFDADRGWWRTYVEVIDYP